MLLLEDVFAFVGVEEFSCNDWLPRAGVVFSHVTVGSTGGEAMSTDFGDEDQVSVPLGYW